MTICQVPPVLCARYPWKYSALQCSVSDLHLTRKVVRSLASRPRQYTVLSYRLFLEIEFGWSL